MIQKQIESARSQLRCNFPTSPKTALYWKSSGAAKVIRNVFIQFSKFSRSFFFAYLFLHEFPFARGRFGMYPAKTRVRTIFFNRRFGARDFSRTGGVIFSKLTRAAQRVSFLRPEFWRPVDDSFFNRHKFHVWTYGRGEDEAPLDPFQKHIMSKNTSNFFLC